LEKGIKTFYIIGLSDNEILTSKLQYTNDVNKAKIFKTFNDAIDFEEVQGDKIEGLTDIYKVVGLKFTKQT
jgi:uncharacterized protein YfkK (UPF0435 family)